jgi:hypothetical protein
MNVDTNSLQAMASIIAPIISLIGFTLIYLQIKELRKSTLGATHGALYTQQHSVHQFFIENPSFRPFFYSNQEISPNHTDYEKVMAIAEMIGDFFEHIYLQRINLPNDIWIGWRNYMLAIYQTSPALREHFGSKRMWYGEKVLKLLNYAEN